VALSRLLVIPAAGRGSRLGAEIPKPLVRVGGRTMLDRLADLYAPFVDHLAVIANPESRPALEAWARSRRATVAVQPAPTGMLDAILLAAPAIAAAQPDTIWVTWADQIGILPSTLDRLADGEGQRSAPALIVPTVRRRDPYIHFPRDREGRIAGLLQQREGDVMPAEGEADIGLFALTRETFERDLTAFARTAVTGAGTGERNFLPFIPWLAQRRTVATIPASDPMEAVGINTPADLRTIEEWLATRSGG
jgi:bifunctional UDP-N-acetylglucosamine pyrophosphorylase / glucosamine-1-phosphate N-acetyltransferase